MTKLICDICGTSYSDTEEKCPTCGYARAMLEPAADPAQPPAVRQKVRGGRFSKKNVRKRLEEQAKAEANAVEATPAPELVEEISCAVAAISAEKAEEAVRSAGEEAAPVTAEEIPAALPAEAEETAQTPEPEETTEPETPAEEPVPEEAPAAQAPAQEEQAQIPAEFLVEMPETEEEEHPQIPVIIFPDLPATEETEQSDLPEEPEAPADEEKKVSGGEIFRSVVFFFSLSALMVFIGYLIAHYAIPYLEDYNWPTHAVVETMQPTQTVTEAPTDDATAAPTDAATEASTAAPTETPTQQPTEAPTERPTDPPTEAPTDPPTDPPTEAPTQPPTEEPTKPLLDVKLELNYYDLTFGAVTQTTQLRAREIPEEDITWISDNTSIVTISDSGLITAVGSGHTTIRAVYGDQEVTVKIRVK